MTSLLEACDDQQLFALPLWDGQRSLLSAYEQSLAAGDWLSVWCIGRRSGKSTLAAVVALWALLFRPDLDELSGIGGRSMAVVICPTDKQSQEMIATAAAIVKSSPLLAPLLTKETKGELEFLNGTRFTSFPASSRSIVGRAVRCFILDEAGHFFDNESGAAHEIDRIFNSMMPATAQFQGKAPVLVTSTPTGDANWFAQMVTRGRNGELEGGRLFHAVSADMNPQMTPEFLAMEQRRDPDSFRGEYLAELIGSGGAFIEPELVDSAVVPRDELPPDACDAWIAGIDPAFTNDPFALVIVGRDRENRDRLRVGCVRTWLPPKRKPETPEARRALEDRVLGEVCEVLLRYRVAAVVHDQHQAAVVAEAMRRRGLWPEEFNLSQGTKLDIFQNLKARILTRTVELYEHETLVAELKRVRARQAGAGRVIETPSLAGTHCDTAIGLALAVAYIDRDGTPGRALPMVIEPEYAGRREKLASALPKHLSKPISVSDYTF